MPSQRAKRTHSSGFIFNVPKNVYEPAEDSFLFADHLQVKQGDSVLDIGTGCGILGIVAAKEKAEVIATDINPHALRCAKGNAIRNDVTEGVAFVQGDLLSPLQIDMRFDHILFNAPYLPVEDQEDTSWLERAWDGGADGRKIIDAFICEAPKYLKMSGRILLLQSTLSDLDLTLRRFREKGMRAEIISKLELPFFESLALVEAVFDCQSSHREGCLQQPVLLQSANRRPILWRRPQSYISYGACSNNLANDIHAADSFSPMLPFKKHIT